MAKSRLRQLVRLPWAADSCPSRGGGIAPHGCGGLRPRIPSRRKRGSRLVMCHGRGSRLLCVEQTHGARGAQLGRHALRFAAQRCKSCESQRQGFRVGDRSRGRYATPAGFPSARLYFVPGATRTTLGFFHRSRTILCRPVPNFSVTIRNLCIAVAQPQPPRSEPGSQLEGLQSARGAEQMLGTPADGSSLYWQQRGCDANSCES
jgi:hypothetical protein